MRCGGNLLVRCGFACAIAAVIATAGWAETSSVDGPGTSASDGPDHVRPRWAIALGLFGGATVQEQSASVDSACADGGPGDPSVSVATCGFLLGTGPEALRSPDSGSDLVVAPFVGGNLQLMSPTLESLPGQPRLFLTGELTFLFPSERSIAIEGDPSRVSLPDTVSGPNAVTSLLLNGVGARTTSDVDTLSYGAGIGMAFPFEYRGRTLWLKPSLVWTRYRIDVEGLVVSGLKDDTLTGPPFGSQIREIILSGSEDLMLDGIGPGLELELEAGRYAGLAISVFGSFNTYRILGDRDVAFSDSVSLPALPIGSAPGSNPSGLPADTYDATWRFSTSPWLFRGAVGIRFQWPGS